MFNNIINILAGIRLTKIIVDDKISRPLNDIIEYNINKNKENDEKRKKWLFLYELITCADCVSVWVGFFLSFSLFFNNKFLEFIKYSLAYSLIIVPLYNLYKEKMG